MISLSTFKAMKSIALKEGMVEMSGETLRACQRVMLGIAEDFISLCEEEGIWYQLGGGTALGAVRHHGFIPWDDDIDLNIRGRDIERLRDEVGRRFGDKYVFLDYSSKGYGLPMCRLMLNGSVYRDRESYDAELCGFFIDLFPIENVPDNPVLRKIHGAFCMVSGGLLSCRRFHENRRLMRRLAKDNPSVRSTVNVKLAIGQVLAFLPLTTCGKVTDWVYGLCKDEGSRFVTIPSGRHHYFGGVTPRHGRMDTVPVDFEGHRWQVAADYDTYLTMLYGPSYMTPPSEGAKEHHMLFELRFPEGIDDPRGSQQ